MGSQRASTVSDSRKPSVTAASLLWGPDNPTMQAPDLPGRLIAWVLAPAWPALGGVFSYFGLKCYLGVLGGIPRRIPRGIPRRIPRGIPRELGRFKAFLFYDFGPGGRGPSGSNRARKSAGVRGSTSKPARIRVKPPVDPPGDPPVDPPGDPPVGSSGGSPPGPPGEAHRAASIDRSSVPKPLIT